MASRHVDLDGFARALLDSVWQPSSGSGSDRLEAAAALCRRWVPGASWVSVSVRSRDQVVTRAATDKQAVRIDEMQYAVGSGPCLSALAEGDVQYVPDLAAEPRWPAWWGRVQEDAVGLAGVVSDPLTPRGNDPAMSLNIYAERAGALDEASLTTSLLLTAHAAAVAETARSREEAVHLRRAVDSNRQIGIATGVLMALRKLDAQRAFELLRSTSQETNRKLIDVAQEVSETGALPERPARRRRSPEVSRG